MACPLETYHVTASGWACQSLAIALFGKGDPVTGRSLWPIPFSEHSDLYQVAAWDKAGHPSGAPVEVLEDLVRRLCRRCVLDPFCGAGSTLVAARRLGLKSVGVDIKEKWCARAAERIRAL